MLPAVIAGLAVLRLGYPAWLERRQRARLPAGPDGVVRGAEPITLRRPQAPAALLLHGGGDTPQVLSGLAHYLYERGFSIRVPLLSAHGRQLSALRHASPSRWHDEVRRELDTLRAEHSWVGVVGLSIGGALAVELANERPEVPAMVLLAPYLEMPEAVRGFASRADVWRWLLPYFPSGGGRSIRDRAAAARALGHGLLTPALLRAFLEVVETADAALPSVRVPTLMIHSKQDNRIPQPAAARGFGRLGAPDKMLEWIEGAGHVITVDFGHERVFQLTSEWLMRHQR